MTDYCKHANVSHEKDHYGLDEPFTVCPDCGKQWRGHISSDMARALSPFERPFTKTYKDKELEHARIDREQRLSELDRLIGLADAQIDAWVLQKNKLKAERREWEKKDGA